MYDYLKDHQFDYLCDCYSESKSGTYYADLTNKTIMFKKDLVSIIYDNTELSYR